MTDDRPWTGSTTKVVADARESIHAALRQLARKQILRSKSGVATSIIDGLMDEVEHMREQAEKAREQAFAEGESKWMLIACRYDELVLNCQVKLMELGVKAGNNEQQSLDRRYVIDEMTKSRREIARDQFGNKAIDADVERKQRLLARQSAMQTVDADFRPTGVG